MSLSKEKLDELMRNSFLNSTSSFIKECLGSTTNTSVKKEKKKKDGGGRSNTTPQQQQQEEQPQQEEEEQPQQEVSVEHSDRLLKSITSSPLQSVTLGDNKTSEVTSALRRIDTTLTLSFLFEKQVRNESIQKRICDRIVELQSEDNSPWRPIKNSNDEIYRYKIENVFEEDATFKGYKVKAKVIILVKNTETESYADITLTNSSDSSKFASFKLPLNKIMEKLSPVYQDSSDQ